MRYMGQSVTHMVSFCLRGFRGGSHLRLPQLFPRALTSPTVTQRVLHTKSLSKLIFLSLGLLSLWYITNDTFLSDHLRLLGSLPDEPFSQSADKSLGPYPFQGQDGSRPFQWIQFNEHQLRKAQPGPRKPLRSLPSTMVTRPSVIAIDYAAEHP